jgi:hypothetical protein
VPEDRLQLFHLQGRSDPEHAPPVEASTPPASILWEGCTTWAKTSKA